MIEKCTLVGGGIASMSAGIRLAELGVKPLLIENGKYPSHKLCGEFFSHECHPLLENWGIEMREEITHCRLVSGNDILEFKFPVSSWGTSRYDFDMMLLEKAKKMGVRVMTETSVEFIQAPKNPYQEFTLTLSNGEHINTHQLMIGTGKRTETSFLMQKEPPPFRYVGFKAHFEGIEMNHFLELHPFKGGYVGLSSVSDKVTNMACLVDQKVLQGQESAEDFFKRLLLLDSMKSLRQRMGGAKMLFPEWIMGKVPEFGIRDNKELDRLYWIGDARASIPPASGDGLAIGITSGVMAAEYLMKKDAKSFNKDWQKKYRKRFFYAKLLHRMLMNPMLCHSAYLLSKRYPSIPIKLWQLTRE